MEGGCEMNVRVEDGLYFRRQCEYSFIGFWLRVRLLDGE